MSDNNRILAYIALGSNIGDRPALLSEALQRLEAHPEIEVLQASSIYETDPVGYENQPPFLNMAAKLSTKLAPLGLLRVMQGIELELGRVRDIRFGPRTLDLDFLLCEDIQMNEDELILPHPRMMERAFVLVPLNDVLEAGHPLEDQIRRAAEQALQGGEGITLWSTSNWQAVSGPSGS
ncbi:2-amino-4-hydroxy-6-hydroxymethyldihydropteridine diphosphokinase [Paenibacillus sp. GCM10027626]|uniref:2-amino-4-hydroxy-6- hydroxymethyldihydropteridine diphosphokinase n=1 Tax=Paenibacillus sp. GCM10027626 TaxID=3273411 RepID=UPI00362B48D3